MAVDCNRQYVGARYVPKVFENSTGGMEWEANTYYEPLTLVTYNNSNYMSKIPVPNNIGNPNSNLKYWVFIGAFNASLNNLENIVSDFIRGYNGLKYRRFVIIGDSYAQGWTPDGTFTSWATLISNAIISFGGRVEIYAKGGAGWAAVGQDNQTFVSLLNSVVEKDTVTDVIVAGGYNDNNKDVNPATIQAAFSQFKNAKCTYFPIGNTYKNSSIRLSLVTSIRMIGAYVGSFVDVKAFTVLHNHILFSSDGIHPNGQGQVEIASYIWGVLNNTLSQAPAYIPIEFDDFPNIEYTSYGDSYAIHIPSITLPSSITGMTPVFSKPLENINVMFPTNDKACVSSFITLKNADGYRVIPFSVYIKSNNMIYITPLLVTNSSFETISGITQSYLTGGVTITLNKYYF